MNILTKIRCNHGDFRQSSLAKRLKTSRTYVSLLESGKREITVDVYKRIKEIYELRKEEDLGLREYIVNQLRKKQEQKLNELKKELGLK